jgi:gliding motility associated protien GldN
MKKLSFLIFGITVCSLSVQAQEREEDNGMNPLSTKSIHVSDIMYQKTVTRAVDLRERQNQPLFAKDHEITRVIIDAVQRGDVQPFLNDSLNTEITVEQFLENITIPSAEAEVSEEDLAFMANDDGGWDDDGDDDGESSAPTVKKVEYFFPKDLYQMQIREDLIFDKQRSRMYYDILAVTMFVPADHPDNIKGIEIPIASFSYKELHDQTFKDNPEAIWFNPFNDAEHRNLADAFELRLFSSYIIKVSNPNDEYIVDTYGGDPKVGIMASQWKAFELLEYEHNLWEF